MSVQKFPIFARILYAIAFTAVGFILCSKIQSCEQKQAMPTIQAKLSARIDAVATQIDSLQTANDSLTGWIIAYKTQKPIIKTTKNTVFVTDTVWQTQQLTDTITKDKFVYIQNPITKIKEIGLKLPTYFILADSPHLQIVGTIDTIGIHADSIRLVNTIALRDAQKRTFFQEKHTLSFAQSNPYISNTMPIYTYKKPTKKGEFIKRAGAFIVGAGIGYGIRAIQKQ